MREGSTGCRQNQASDQTPERPGKGASFKKRGVREGWMDFLFVVIVVVVVVG